MRLAHPLLAVLLLMPPAAAPAADVTHSPEHRAAVNRRRRIFFQNDPAADIQFEGGFGSDMEALMGHVFDFADMPGSQLDAICIDVSNEGVAHHRSTVLRPIAHPGLVKWRAAGLDYFDYFDCFHATDGYRGTYLHQGADGVGIFNGPAGSVEHAQRIGVQQQDAAVRDYHSEFLTMVGSLETLAGRPRSYAIDRRGGYAHGEGHGSANAAAPLPVDLRYDGGSAALTLRVAVNRTGPFPPSKPVKVEKVELRLE